MKIKKFLKENISLIIAFCIPVAIMIIIYMARGIYPFGDQMYLRSDMYHQYAPFHMALKKILSEGGSLFYSWDIGLGTNFVSLAAYYLASPINLLLVFVSESHVIEAMSVFIIFKMGLCGFTFSYYISKHFNTKHISIALFSVFYALSAYVAAFSWNLMWADCLVLLPIIALGIERLVKENKPLMYCLSLGAAIYSNYYIGIMLSIFSVLYFIIMLVSRKGLTAKAVLVRMGKYALYSLISGGMAAVMILPAYYTLGLSASGEFDFPDVLTRYFSVLYMISRMLMDVDTAIFEAHDPNLYCTVAVFMFLPLYFFNKKINLREKIGKTLLVVFMLFSFSLNIPNYIWHGFHFPNSLPARESFIFIFLILTMSFEGFQGIKRYSDKTIYGVFAGNIALFVIIAQLFIDDDTYTFDIVYISFIFVFLYFCLIFALRKKKAFKGIVIYLFFFVTIIEAAINTGSTAISTTSRTAYVSDNEAIETLVDEVDESDDTVFYRMEKYERRTKNDAAWIGYSGASLFSSTTIAGVSEFYGVFGLEESTNAYSIYGATPLTQSMLSVKYWISNSEIDDDPLVTEVEEEDGIYIYENEYWLSLGYMIPSDVEDYLDMSSTNPFIVQNNFAYYATGETDLFTSVALSTSGDALEYTATEDARLYVYLSTSLDSVVVNYCESDGTYITTETYDSMTHCHIIDLGDLEEGQYVTIMSNDEDVTTISGTAATLDYDVLDNVMTDLESQQLELEEVDGTYVKGTITVTEAGTMLTSIPYEEGWTVYVDGEEVDAYAFEDAFLAIDLDEGEHVIELKFSPVGFAPGLAISISSVALLVILQILVRRNKKRVLATAQKDEDIIEDFINKIEISEVQRIIDETNEMGKTGESDKKYEIESSDKSEEIEANEVTEETELTEEEINNKTE